jgi:hypothetical protein
MVDFAGNELMFVLLLHAMPIGSLTVMKRLMA